jgi:antitoxin MazE
MIIAPIQKIITIGKIALEISKIIPIGKILVKLRAYFWKHRSLINDILMIYRFVERRFHMSRDVCIAQWGNSLGIRLPKESCRRLGLKAGDSVELDVTEDEGNLSLVIRKKEEPFNLASLFDGYEGTYQPELLDWGTPVGKEVWL